MLCDGTRYLDDGGFLEGVGADHAAGDLAGDGDEGDAVEHGVGEAADEVGGAGAGGGDADAGDAGGTGVALGGEDATLLVAGEDVADGGGAGECLVDLHGSTTGVGEHVRHALPLQRLHEDVGALAGLLQAESGDKIFGGGGGGGFRGCIGEGAGDFERRALGVIGTVWEGGKLEGETQKGLLGR